MFNKWENVAGIIQSHWCVQQSGNGHGLFCFSHFPFSFSFCFFFFFCVCLFASFPWCWPVAGASGAVSSFWMGRRLAFHPCPAPMKGTNLFNLAVSWRLSHVHVRLALCAIAASSCARLVRLLLPFALVHPTSRTGSQSVATTGGKWQKMR